MNETAKAPARSSPARSRLRYINFALLGVAIVLGVIYTVTHWRDITFRLTGKVDAEGSTFYLHADDNYLTPLIVKTGEYEPTETRLTRSILKKGDVFIDVGANIGWYSVHAAKIVGSDGQVIAFEPEPNNLDLLRRNVAANGLSNVVVDSRGLSNEVGSFKLFLEKNNLGMHSLIMEHDGQKYIDVQTIRFDDYWAGKGPIKLVKIDTEGAEGLIVDGMRDTLKTQKNLELIMEFAPHRLRKSGFDPDQLLSDLYAMGYKASLIDEVNDRVIELGTPLTRDIGLPRDDSVTNLHFKR